MKDHYRFLTANNLEVYPRLSPHHLNLPPTKLACKVTSLRDISITQRRFETRDKPAKGMAGGRAGLNVEDVPGPRIVAKAAKVIK